MTFPYILQGDNIVVVVDNTPHSINKSHPSYALILKAIKEEDWDRVRNLVDVRKSMVMFSKGNITIENDKVLWKGRTLNDTLASRIIQMQTEGFSIDPMIAFVDNLMRNPSKRAVDELYRFLEGSSLPITSDGHFLAYKSVRASYYDVHSDSVLNCPVHLMTSEQRAQMPMVSNTDDRVRMSISSADLLEVEMDRSRVDDNKEHLCSSGLHFCSMEYLKRFGGSRIVILKINPADVVSIPIDYNNTKGRTSRYQVIDELQGSLDAAFDRAVQDIPVGGREIPVSKQHGRGGKPLSMTKNAIRKRRARALARQEKNSI